MAKNTFRVIGPFENAHYRPIVILTNALVAEEERKEKPPKGYPPRTGKIQLVR
jgi:hypothetical protein